MAHCYRMLGSAHDADDAVQDALLRAWKGIDRFEGRSSVRSWLYSIATRTALDVIDRRGRRALPMDLGPSSDRAVVDGRPLTDVAWLGAWPSSPEERYEERESVELAFVAALQHLPGNQRAALLLFDVLGLSARETADAMETTPTSVHSAVQRARRLLDERRPAVSQQEVLGELGDLRLREVVGRYTAALQSGDVDALVALLAEDATWSMPPLPAWYRGHGAVADFLVRMPLRHRWLRRPVVANGQPAVAAYQWVDGVFTGYAIDVLTLRIGTDGRALISDVTAFIDADQFARFGLPGTLAAGQP